MVNAHILVWEMVLLNGSLILLVALLLCKFAWEQVRRFMAWRNRRRPVDLSRG